MIEGNTRGVEGTGWTLEMRNVGEDIRANAFEGPYSMKMGVDGPLSIGMLEKTAGRQPPLNWMNAHQCRILDQFITSRVFLTNVSGDP